MNEEQIEREVLDRRQLEIERRERDASVWEDDLSRRNSDLEQREEALAQREMGLTAVIAEADQKTAVASTRLAVIEEAHRVSIAHYEDQNALAMRESDLLKKSLAEETALSRAISADAKLTEETAKAYVAQRDALVAHLREQMRAAERERDGWRTDAERYGEELRKARATVGELTQQRGRLVEAIEQLRKQVRNLVDACHRLEANTARGGAPCTDTGSMHSSSSPQPVFRPMPPLM